ncbi:MAG: hypothetical protein QM479_11075 [Pseudomonadota bacterium]
MTDNLRGDDILTGRDGKILDAALPIVVAAALPTATSIPTLSVWGLLLLIALIGLFGFKYIYPKKYLLC